MTRCAAYRDEPFIEVLPIGEAPARAHSRVQLLPYRCCGPIDGRAIVIAALDNLTKGSSGQALQNANLMLGIDETEGLMMAPCSRSPGDP